MAAHPSRPYPAPPRWFDSPHAIHDNRSLGFELPLHVSRPQEPVRGRDVARGRPGAPRSSSPPRPELWQPPIIIASSSSSLELADDDSDSDFYRASPSQPVEAADMASRAAYASPPPSIVDRSLLQDPAFASDNRFNPNLWISQGAVDPTISESYVVPFARGLPSPAPYTTLAPPRSRADVQYAKYDPPSLPSSSSSSLPSQPSSEDQAQLPYLHSAVPVDPAPRRPDEKKRSKKAREKARESKRSAPPRTPSPLALPTYEESISDYSSTSPSTPSTPARPPPLPIHEKPPPVVLSYNPPPPDPNPQQPPRREPMRRQTSRPPARDLDSIDELDESNPYGVGIHHNGPYEAIAAILGQDGADSKARASSKGGKHRKRDDSDAGYSNPVKLNLKPGQVLKGSIFQPPAVQPSNPQPYPFQRAPATYPTDLYIHAGQDASYLQPSEVGPSRLHRSQTMPTSGDSPLIRDGNLLETDPITFVNGYTVATAAPDDVASHPRPRGPHDRPTSLYSLSGPREMRERSSIPNPYSPIPPIHLDAQHAGMSARSSIPNPYSPLPSARPEERPQSSRLSFAPTPSPPPPRLDERPGAFPAALPQPLAAGALPVTFSTQQHQQRDLSRRRYSPPTPSSSPPRHHSPRERTNSHPSPHEQLAAPATVMSNIALNRSSPDFRAQTGAPSVRTGGTASVRTNGSHGPLPPRHVPRRLVMPTPLASSPDPGAYQYQYQPLQQQRQRQHPPPLPPAPLTAPPYLPRGAAPPAPTPGVRFAHTASPPRAAETVTRYDEGARNLLRKRSAPPAPRSTGGGSGNGGGNSGGGTGFLAVLGLCKTGQKTEMREVEVRAQAGTVEVRRAQTMKEGPGRREAERENPRRVLSKRR